MLTCLGAAASDRHTHTHTHTRPLACSLWRAHVIRVLVVVYVPTCDFHLGATIITVWCRVSTGVRPSRESALPAAAPSQSWVTPTLQTPTGARQPQRPPPIRRTINICPASLGEHCRPAAIHCLGRCSSCTSAAGRYLPQTRSHVMSTSRTCERTQPHTAASQSPRPWFSAGGRRHERGGRWYCSTVSTAAATRATASMCSSALQYSGTCTRPAAGGAAHDSNAVVTSVAAPCGASTSSMRSRQSTHAHDNTTRARATACATACARRALRCVAWRSLICASSLTSGTSAWRTSSSISVHPRITPSAPRAARART